VLGGYAAVPGTIGAILARVPIVVMEQNARAGAANRLAGRFAKACAVPFDGNDLPRAVVTGNPVRSEILAVDRARDRDHGRRELGLPLDRTVIAVFSGSLGSSRVNRAVEGLVERWPDRADLAVHHVLGARDWDAALAASSVPAPDADDAGAGIFYQRVRYEDRMPEMLAAADLLIGRAGGSTVAELTVVGLGAVLVPLPIATRDHQTANAAPLVDVGAAVVVPDGEFDADRLAAELSPLLDAPGRLAAMAVAAHSLAHPDAAQRVVELIEEHARHG
jgi:UDP-N-acetylglucosamine--N-acetylmuramyl-(pentapeptide) pyrophosphoryl-undecaprenol N-acetylglucosamine transferase